MPPKAHPSSRRGALPPLRTSSSCAIWNRRDCMGSSSEKHCMTTNCPCKRRCKRQGAKSAMLAKRIIPCLDVKAGRVVKGTRFLNLVDAGDPVHLAQRYNEE